MLGIFKIALRLRDGHIFLWQSVKILNVFNIFNFEADFLENENFFKKLEYSFLVESTEIENVSFPYKTATSETNVKTNVTNVSLVTKNGPITKNGVFYFLFFLEILFQFNNLL